MSQPITLTINTRLLTGVGLPNGTVKLTLTATDVDVGAGAGVVLPTEIEVQLDAAGVGSTPCLASANGTQGTQLVARFYDAAGLRQGKSLKATVPDVDCYLHEIVDLQPEPPLSDAQAAENRAQSYASQAGASATAAETAKTDAQAVLTDAGFVAVKDDLPNINTVAGSIGGVNAVAAIAADVSGVASIAADVSAVAADLANVDAVAADLANVDAVAGSIGSVNTAAANMPAIVAAPDYATQAQTSASDALAIYGNTAAMNAALTQAQSLFNRIYLGAF